MTATSATAKYGVAAGVVARVTTRKSSRRAPLPSGWLTEARKARIRALWGRPLAEIADEFKVSTAQIVRVSTLLRRAGEIAPHPEARSVGQHDPAGSPLWWKRAARMDAAFSARVRALGLSFADDNPRAAAEAFVFRALPAVTAHSLMGCAAAQCVAMGDGVGGSEGVRGIVAAARPSVAPGTRPRWRATTADDASSRLPQRKRNNRNKAAFLG